MYSEVEIKIPKLSTVKCKLKSLSYLKVEWEESFAICIEVGTESLAIDSEEGLRVPTYTLPNQGELRVASCPQ